MGFFVRRKDFDRLSYLFYPSDNKLRTVAGMFSLGWGREMSSDGFRNFDLRGKILYDKYLYKVFSNAKVIK